MVRRDTLRGPFGAHKPPYDRCSTFGHHGLSGLCHFYLALNFRRLGDHQGTVKDKGIRAFHRAWLNLKLHVLFAQEPINICPGLRLANNGFVDIDLLHSHCGYFLLAA